MTDPNADLADIRQHWLAFCSHDTGLPYPCICPTEDHRPLIAALVGEVETLRAEVARLERIANPPLAISVAVIPNDGAAIRAAIMAGIAEQKRERDAARAEAPADSQDEPRRRDDAADLRERLAAIEHERWADWQRYVHGQCERLIGAGAALVIPSELVERWERRIATPYADLSESEKDADRRQVDRYWWLIAELLADRDEARTKLARCREDRDEYGGQAAAAEKDADQIGRRLAEVLIERDEAQALLRLAPHHQQQVVTLEYELVQARAEVENRNAAFELMLAETRQQRDELRGALAAALKDDAIEQGYASGRDDARRLVQAHIDNGEAGDWPLSVMEALRAVAEDLDGDRTAEIGVGRWLELVWKQAIEDRDAAWRALDSLGIDPRHAEAGAQRFLAAVDRMAPSIPPSTPESDGQGEVAVTDAVEAPGGAEACPHRNRCPSCRCVLDAGHEGDHDVHCGSGGQADA